MLYVQVTNRRLVLSQCLFTQPRKQNNKRVMLMAPFLLPQGLTSSLWAGGAPGVSGSLTCQVISLIKERPTITGSF